MLANFGIGTLDAVGDCNWRPATAVCLSCHGQAEAAVIEASKKVALGTPWKARSRVGMYEFEIDDT
jgi:hypothetical protein